MTERWSEPEEMGKVGDVDAATAAKNQWILVSGFLPVVQEVATSAS